jgi:hypothetical protein
MITRRGILTAGVAAPLVGLSSDLRADPGGAENPGKGPVAHVLDVTDFGIVAGDDFALAKSNSDAVDALLAYLLANNPNPGREGNPAIKVTVPAGRFRFARPWVVKCALWLEGQSNSQRFAFATSFDFELGGFEFHGAGTDHGGVVSPPTTSAGCWRLENLACSSRAAIGTGHHGLHAVVRGDVIRCTFNAFPGDGILIESETGFGATNNNANQTRILFCQAGGNGGSGIHLIRGDANVVTTLACDLHANGEFGIFDNAFLSNSHTGHHSEGNGLGLVYPGHKMGPVGSVCTVLWPAWGRGVTYAVVNPGGQYRTNAGKLYWLLSAGAGNTANAPTHTNAAGVVEADGYKWAYAGTSLYCRYHTTIGGLASASTTAPGTNINVWVPFEFASGVSPGMPLWVSGMTWKNGGSYCGNSAAAETVWTACYSEGSQPPAQIRSPQIWVGGQTPPSPWSTCVQIRSNLGAINNPNGIHAEKQSHNGQSIYARFGADLAAGNFMSVGHPTLFPSPFSAVQDRDTRLELQGVGTYITFTGSSTTFTAGRSTAQPGVVNIPRFVLGAGASARSIDYGNAAPTTGPHAAGELVYNTAPKPGGFVGWICTTAGTPGTWKTFGAISE